MEKTVGRILFLFQMIINFLILRNEGIAWIVIELWNLGENVTLNNLPNYLDFKAKEFVIAVFYKFFSFLLFIVI